MPEYKIEAGVSEGGKYALIAVRPALPKYHRTFRDHIGKTWNEYHGASECVLPASVMHMLPQYVAVIRGIIEASVNATVVEGGPQNFVVSTANGEYDSVRPVINL